MERQNFSRELQGTFNLREPKGTKPTMIYFVVRLNGKQYKLTTGVKVYPSMWSKATQTAIVSNQQTKQDNNNNRLVNEKLSEINAGFSKFISYLCSVETIGNEHDILKTYIYKDMKVKKEVNTISIIESAFEYYYRSINPNATEGTLKTNEESLNIFKKYVQEKKLEKDLKVFSQSGLNAFRDYLISKDNAPKRVNSLCQIVARLINKVLCVNDEYLGFGFSHIEYVTLKDTRSNDEIGHFPLNNDEVKKLQDCKNLTKKLERTRNIFLFQIKCGWRYGDIENFMKGQYQQSGNVITIQTEKKDITAYLNVDDEVAKLIANLNGIEPLHISKYNVNLKELAKVAGLTRVVTYKDSKGIEHNEPIHEIISSHWARYTMINNEIKKGTPIEIIVKKAGHKDETMIRKIYTKLTKDEKIEEFAGYYQKPKEESEVSNNDALQVLFAYDELKAVNAMLESDNDGFHTEATKEAIRKIKSLSDLSNYKEVNTDKVKELERIVFIISWYFKDAELLATFQLKQKYFGMIDKIESYDDIQLRFHNEDEAIKEGWEALQLKEWEERNPNTDEALQELFAYNEIMMVKEILRSFNDGYNTEVAKEAIKKIKNLSKLPNYKKVNTDKVNEIEGIIESIAGYYKDVELLTAYQTKKKHFGMIANIDSYETLSNKVRQWKKDPYITKVEGIKKYNKK